MCSGKELLKEVVHYLSLDAPSHPPHQQEQLRGTRSFQSMSFPFAGLISFSFGSAPSWGTHDRVVCSLPGSLSSLDLAVARFAEAETWAYQKSASMSRSVHFHTFPSLGRCPVFLCRQGLHSHYKGTWSHWTWRCRGCTP